jgi:hypothetical protein
MAARAWSGVILAACATRSTMVLIDLAPAIAKKLWFSTERAKQPARNSTRKFVARF